jgi:hypothetical protein
MDTHKVLRHHAFLTPLEPAQSIPSSTLRSTRSQATLKTSNRLLNPPRTPQKSRTNGIPPTSWKSSPSKASQDKEDEPLGTSASLGSFLSIPSSPLRPRSRMRMARSAASESTQGEDETSPRRKNKMFRNSFIRGFGSSDEPDGEGYHDEGDDLALLARVKRVMLTDDSAASLLRLELERSAAERRIICGSGGLGGVVDRVQREVDRLADKSGIIELFDEGQELDKAIQEVQNRLQHLTKQELDKRYQQEPSDSSHEKGGSTSSTIQNKGNSTISMEASHLQVPNQTAPNDFLVKNRLFKRPSFLQEKRGPPSQTSGKSGSNFLNDFNKRTMNTGMSLFGLDKGPKITAPMQPVQGIINRNAVSSRGGAPSSRTGQVEHTGPRSSSEREYLGKLEIALKKLIRETERLKTTKEVYDERVELLGVKWNGAELRERLTR